MSTISDNSYYNRLLWLTLTLCKTHVKSDEIKILDLGCGDSSYLKDLQAYFPKAETTGIDNKTNLIQKAQKENLNSKYLLLNIENANLIDVMEPQSVDVILLIGILPYIHNYSRLFAQIRILLKPKGTLVIINHLPNTWTETYLKFKRYFISDKNYLNVQNISNPYEVLHYLNGFYVQDFQLIECGGIPSWIPNFFDKRNGYAISLTRP